MKLNTKQEKIFDDVLIAYNVAGKQMDVWTQAKYINLKEQFDKKGNLSSAQENLLASLIKYIPKSPAIKQESNEEIENATPMTPEERFPNYDINLVNDVLEFEAKMRTSWFPTKEEIFKYGYNMRRLGKHYSPPKKWNQEFEEYESNNLHF